jgi:hypothetical protein
MKGKRYLPEQIIKALAEAAEAAVGSDHAMTGHLRGEGVFV